jgi:hypothetical protein
MCSLFANAEEVVSISKGMPKERDSKDCGTGSTKFLILANAEESIPPGRCLSLVPLG